MKMIEARCENPHPRLRRTCRAITRASATTGQVDVECWRCHGYVHFNFDKEGTEVLDKVSTL